MAAFQQAGDFSVVPINGKMAKNGGNVVSYFCTPDGHLVHAVGGPVSPERLLVEAKWAADVARSMRSVAKQHRAEFLREAHRRAALPTQQQGGGLEWRADSERSQGHGLLVNYAYQPVRKLESTLFRKLSGENFEADRSAVYQAARQFERAESKDRPVLLVLSNRGPRSGLQAKVDSRAFAVERLNNLKPGRILRRFEVVFLSREKLPALTNLQELTGWESLKDQSVNRWNQDSYLVVASTGKILFQVNLNDAVEFSEQLELAHDIWKNETRNQVDSVNQLRTN